MAKSIYIIYFLFLIFLSFSVKAGEDKYFAENGVIDLSGHDFQKNGSIQLKGKWKFIPGHFFNAEEFKKQNSWCLLDVPKNWKKQKCNDSILSAHGYGTYYLQIIVNPNHLNDFYRLNTRYIPNASVIYLNEKKVGEGGIIGKTKDECKPSLTISLYDFSLDNDTLDLIIHVSNFHLNKGGLYYEIDFGISKDINRTETVKNINIFFIIGSVFLMILYYMILFLLRKKEKSSLYFSILCFTVTIYALCLSSLYFYFFPYTGFSFDYKIKHIMIYFALTTLSAYIHQIFNKEFSKTVLKIIVIVGSVFSLAMIILPTDINSLLFSYYRYFGALTTIYIIYVIARAKINKREGAGIFIVGLIIIFIAVINDSLHNLRIINTGDFLPLSMFLFLFLQTYILSSRFTKSFAKNEQLTEELTYINKNLEKIVEQRTEQIMLQKKEIEEKNEELNQLLEEVTSQRDEIESQRNMVLEQKNKIEEINHEVSQSIDYAKRIQSAILSDPSILAKNLSEYFVLFKPKDKVSGDFYWWHEVEGHLLIAAVDCTGHGVPGGFMSMLGISFLREIIVKEYITHPGIVLRRLRKEIINVMKQKGESGEQKDGMDMVLVSIDISTKVMQFSGANNPLYLVRNGELAQHVGDKMPIAIYEKMDKFATTEIQLKEGDQLYMFSDGFADQFGGPDCKKFKYKPFKELLLKNSLLKMEEQKTILDKTLSDWMGNFEQIDDILVLGIKI